MGIFFRVVFERQSKTENSTNQHQSPNPPLTKHLSGAPRPCIPWLARSASCSERGLTTATSAARARMTPPRHGPSPRRCQEMRCPVGELGVVLGPCAHPVADAAVLRAVLHRTVLHAPRVRAH